MSKVRLAEYHYRKALEIHPRNAVLMGCVGMVSSHIASTSCGVSDGAGGSHRLSSAVGTVKVPLSYLIERCDLHRKMLWFVIAGPKFSSL